MIRIYTTSRVLSMGDTMGCGVVSIRVNRHFSRHGKLGPPEGRELGLVYTIRKAPADNGTLRRGTTSDERKGRPCWRFHCPAWWSNSQENMQINYLQRLTRKLRLVKCPANSWTSEPCSIMMWWCRDPHQPWTFQMLTDSNYDSGRLPSAHRSRWPCEVRLCWRPPKGNPTMPSLNA